MAVAYLNSPLRSEEGDLVCIHISIDPWHLENLLEALSSISFPVNPEIRHLNHSVQIEFPAYSSRVDEVRAAVRTFGFTSSIVEVGGMLVS